jgi:hypothetical protein
MAKQHPVSLVLALVAGSIFAACSGADSSSNNAGGDGGSNTGNGGGPGTQDGGGVSGDGGVGGDSSSGGNDSGGGGGADSGGGGGTDSGGGGADSGGGGKDSGGGANPIKTVFVILMENHNWSTIKGSASAPYINNTLLPAGAHAENYFDNPKGVHPSEPNYIWIEAGDNLGFTTDVDPSSSHEQTTPDHFVSQLTAKSISWKSYQEDLTAGACGTVSSGLYAAKHNPMVFFTDVSGSPPSNSNAGCITHVRPYSELAADLSNNSVARYNFITPNLCNDMHNSTGCASTDSVKNGDTWLSTEVPKILASQAYKDNGALFITWDESEGGEYPIGMIVLSPKAKVGYSNTTKYYHSSLLRTEEEIFGVTLLRDAANQSSLSDLFTSYP